MINPLDRSNVRLRTGTIVARLVTNPLRLQTKLSYDHSYDHCRLSNMGGSAFASCLNPLRTPRMPTAVYLFVKSRCQTILKEYYTHVATPIEAPDKKDYGDVDFLVACPTQLCQRSGIVETIEKALGAERSISIKGSPTTNFALPWPRELHRETPGSHLPPDAADADHMIFVQVDVHVCESKEGWDWELFLHEHGDFWEIMRSIVRRYGLTIHKLGLFLRIEEIDRISDRKRSMVFLSKRPSDVLSFLGLDESLYWHQFESAQAMYEYVASCRYFSTDDDIDSVNERDKDKRGLEHIERRRINKRPGIRKWVEEFLPQCRASGTYNRRAPLREQIRDDCFERFGVKNEYDQKLKTWLIERQKNEIWRNFIKAGLPTVDVAPAVRAASIRGLKAIVLEGDLSYGVIPPKALKTGDGFYDIDAVVEFLTHEWQHVGAIELEKQRVRAVEKMADRIK